LKTHIAFIINNVNFVKN